MNKLILFNAGIDIKTGLERFNNNEELYKKWLRNFITDHHYSDMLDAINRKDIKNAFSLAHSLKGMVGNLSFTNLYSDMCPLVEILRDGNFDNIDTYLDKIDDAYKLIINALKEANI